MTKREQPTPPASSPHSGYDAIARLCTACGLCCSGVIFGDVELQPNDNPDRLRDLGIKLERKGRKLRFRQPCPCLQDGRCAIYAERPSRCRAFDCRLLQAVQRGEMDAAAALRKIAQARRAADRVRDVLRQLGQHDEALPLNRRYALVMQEPIDLSADDGYVDLRSRLMLDVDSLVKRLDRDFLT